MKTAPTILFLLVASGCATGTSHIDVLDETVFNGNWSTLIDVTAQPNRCDFPVNWYLVTGVATSESDGDKYVSVYGLEWQGCTKYRNRGKIMSTSYQNYSVWATSMYKSYCVTERVWNSQPLYVKNALNKTERFMGVVPNRHDNWSPYFGRPNNMPDVEVQNVDHIFCRVSIAFENASMINGTMCVADKSNMIPLIDVWSSVDGIKSYERCEDCISCEDMSAKLIDLNKTVNMSEQDDMVELTVDVVLKWGYYCRLCWISGDDIPCKDLWRNTTETARFTASAPIPEIVSPSRIGSVSAQITMYNNSFDPYTLIKVDVPENVTITTFRYQNNAAKHFHGIGFVNNSSMVVEYRNDTLWKETPQQNIITHLDEFCVIRDAPLNFTELLITVSSPYETVIVTNYSVTMINSKPTDYVNLKKLFLYILLIGIPLWGAVVNVRRWRL